MRDRCQASSQHSSASPVRPTTAAKSSLSASWTTISCATSASSGRTSSPFWPSPTTADPSRMLKILCCHGRVLVERVRDGFAPRPASCC
jgi:hypothetical protein